MMAKRHAWKDGEGGYKVYNREGKPLKIVLDVCPIGYDEHMIIPRCPCERGSREMACYHAGVVLRRMLREKMGLML